MYNQMLDVSEISTLLHCSDATVRRLIDAGRIKGIRLSDTAPRRVHKDELQRYADEREIELDWSLITEVTT